MINSIRNDAGHHRAPARDAATASKYSPRLFNSIISQVVDFMHMTILYRPVGPKELALISASGWTKFPPRLPQQPIFYPVTNEAYAIQIARDWNVPASGCGFVIRFSVDAHFLQRYPVQNVGGTIHDEDWVPAEELDEFNMHIIGRIAVMQAYA